MSYFVIYPKGDGLRIEVCECEALEKRLDDEWWGDVQFLDELPPMDPTTWRNSLLIIKGEIVIPQVKKRVTHWELP